MQFKKFINTNIFNTFIILTIFDDFSGHGQGCRMAKLPANLYTYIHYISIIYILYMGSHDAVNSKRRDAVARPCSARSIDQPCRGTRR